MIIRHEQMAVFQEQATKNFEDRAIEYLQESFPAHCENLGAEQLGGIFRFGKKRAEAYQCFGERSIVIYLYLMFLQGSAFDTDPLFRWAARILKDGKSHEINRTESLWEQAHRYAFLVYGPGNENLQRARRKMEEYQFFAGAGQLENNFNGQLSQLLKNLFPEKYNAHGMTALSRLMSAGAEKAAGNGLGSKVGTRLIIVLMFMLGSGFDSDPVRPRLGNILRDETINDAKEKIALLQQEATSSLGLNLRRLTDWPTFG